MIALLDTNVLYWWLNDPSRLSAAAEAAIVNRSNSVVVSAVVPWELAIKTNLGKLRAEPLLSIWNAKLADEGFSELPINSAHGIRAGLLRRYHRDPFDRRLGGAGAGDRLAYPQRRFGFRKLRRTSHLVSPQFDAATNLLSSQ